MLRCALCCNWFHHICVDLDPSIPDGVWTCPTCRTISKDVGEIKNTLNIVLGMLTAQTETIVSLKDSLNEKSKECKNLIKENLELNKKVHSLVKKNNMSNIQKSLLIGSSIIREVSEDKLVNTDVVCKRGGTISDICKEVEKISKGHYNHIAMVVGGNDCSSQPSRSPTDTVEGYSKLIDAAKAKAETVTDSSICPRLTSDELQQNIDAVNAGLIAMCGEKQVLYADSTPCFRLGDGSINDGYLMEDGVHITKQATNKLIQCLQLSVRNSDVGVCKDTKSQHSMSRDKSYKVTHYKKQYKENDSE